MGTIRNGGNGAFSGKAGSIIGSSWPDIRKQSQICLCIRQPATGNPQQATSNKLIGITLIILGLVLKHYPGARLYEKLLATAFILAECSVSLIAKTVYSFLPPTDVLLQPDFIGKIFLGVA